MSSKIDKNEASGRSMRYPKLLACRGCLATRCKLYNIENCKLMDVYSLVVGLGITTTDGLPQHICVNCLTMCRKFLAFRNKCRKAQELLQFGKKKCLTTRDVENIDRKDLGQLFQTQVICFDCVEENDSNIQREDNEDKNNVGALIEIEALIEPEIKNDSKIDVNLIEMPTYESDDNNDDNNDDVNDVSVKFDSDDSGPTDKSDSDSDWDKTEVPIEVEVDEDKKRKAKDSTKSGKRSKNGKGRKQRKKETKPRKLKLTETLNRQPKGFNAEAFSKEFSLKHNVDIVQLSREQQLAALDARKSSRNYVTSPLKCELCYKGFLTEDALAAHRGIHEASRGEYICDICRYRFKKPMHLTMHQRKHRVRYVCKDCGTVSTCNQNAIRHHQWHKGQRHPCKYCDVVFEKRNSLVSHVHKKHGIEMDMCELCGAPYSGNLGLIRHRMNSHGGQIPVTRVEDKCPACSIQFLNADALRNHQRMNCAQEKIWSCVTCGENLTSKLLLKEHLMNTHSKYDPNKEYKCEECGNTFASTIALGKHIQAIHLLRKTGDEEWKNKYVCEACGKRFPFPSVLRKHQIRVHNGEKGQGSQPKVRVRLEEDPARPLRTISGDKLYKCPHCPKVFQSTTNRQVHVRTHTGERPYVCPECGRAFSSGASLQRHARVHTGEKPYSCPQCGKSFTQSNSMKLHVTTVHLKLPAPYKSKRRPPDVK